MGQIKFVGGIFLTAIFVVAIISFVVNFGEDNQAVVQLGDDPTISTLNTNVQSDLYTFKDTANSSSEAFGESTIESGDETSVSGGVFKAFVGPFASIKRIFGAGTTIIFGDDQGNSGFGIILTSLASFFVFLLTMYIWKTWKGGNPE